MKRITTLLMAAIMVIGAAGLAGAAVEFNTSGHMHLLFGVKDNGLDTGFDKDVPEDNFYAGQRFRPKLTMKAEGVTAVFEAQQHQAYWGSDWPVGGNPDAYVRIRQAYVQFKLPSTPVELKVGYQQLNLPSIWGHPVFQARVGAAMATIPFNDQVALSAFWARPADEAAVTKDATGTIVDASDPSHNSTDMFGALLPLNFGAVKATPYFVYSRIGKDTSTVAAGVASLGGDTDVLIVGGANLEIMATDALSIKADAIVTNYSSDIATRDYGTGWMIAAAVDYALPWGTPGVFAWYATGADDKGEGALVTVKTDGFGPTSWGFEGYNTWALGAQVGNGGSSTCAIGVQLADMSFVDSLKHTVRVAYIMGTGDKDLKVAGVKERRAGEPDDWTTKDSFIEVNLDSTWAVYENLAAVVELGALIPDFGSNTKFNANNNPDGLFNDDTALRAQLTLRFSF